MRRLGLAGAAPAAALAAVCALPGAAGAQGVVVDQGRFAVTLDGTSAGTEEFTIRRAGLGGDAAIFANGTVTLTRPGGTQQIVPLLRTLPPDGVANQYQVEVTGIDALDLRLRLAQRRYVAVIQSELGEEQREFPAQPDTRIVEVDVAHHYYFLRDVREGAVTPVLEPRMRGHLQLLASATRDDELRLGQTTVPARRIELSAGEDRRVVWFDRIGRVLRVEIPARRYVAERVDLLR
ncbi:MAG TPA: hypothetical protein VMM35_12820 [Longimicrobiales bacterium]|nr:hypothetical protein [Longimicrobiales bacterium]